METRVFPDADAASVEAARYIAARIRHAVADRGRFAMALSGGATPRRMLRALAQEDVPWDAVHLLQVDERVAPDGHPDRNFTALTDDLLSRAPLVPARIHPMPVTLDDLGAAATRYAATLAAVAGPPPVLDLVHLGLGADGHTASLVPGDPVLGVGDADVAITEPYQGRRRMTLTYPVLDRARLILWFVTGAGKADVLARLRDGDDEIPAGRVGPEHAVIFADHAALRVT